MKVIDCSKIGAKKKGFLGLPLGGSPKPWTQKDAHAQEIVIAALQKVLDNRFVMLRHVILEGPDVPIPMILVGPPGVRVMYASSIKGFYRAKEDVWEEMDERTQRFNLARPNLLTRTLLMGRAVDAFLTARNQQVELVEAVLFFTDAGVHIETSRPAVRIVLADALDRFAAGLVQSRQMLNQEEVQKVVETLTGTPMADRPSQPVTETHDAFSFRDQADEQPKPVTVEVYEDDEHPIIKKIPFNRRQLWILGILVAVNILILIALVVIVLLSS